MDDPVSEFLFAVLESCSNSISYTGLLKVKVLRCTRRTGHYPRSRLDADQSESYKEGPGSQRHNRLSLYWFQQMSLAVKARVSSKLQLGYLEEADYIFTAFSYVLSFPLWFLSFVFSLVDEEASVYAKLQATTTSHKSTTQSSSSQSIRLR